MIHFTEGGFHMKNFIYSNNFFLSLYNWGSTKFTPATIVILVVLNTIILGMFFSGYVSVFVSVYIMFIHNMKIDIEELKNKNIREEDKDKIIISS